MHDVFISYSSINKNVADAICHNFESSGIRCWYAPRDIGVGKNWQEEIIKAIRGSKVFVLVFTKASNESDDVLREVTAAAKSGCVIMPFRLDNVDACDRLSYYLDSVHWLDAMTSDLEKYVNLLRERVVAVLKIPGSELDNCALSDQPPSPRKPFSRAFAVASAAVLCVVVLAVCVFFIYKNQTYDFEERYLLALGYISGVGVDKDPEHGVKILKELSLKGFAIAQYNLGLCYYDGIGVDRDYEETVKWYTKAAEQGNANAQYNLGLCYYDGIGVDRDYEETIKWYTKAAEQGNASAQCNLGLCYLNGNGVDRDYGEAVNWFRKSAEQGDAFAQYNLGLCYYDGIGVDCDYAESVKWFTQVAEQGNAYAQYLLGLCYYSEKGVDQDYKEAKKWFEKAAEQNYKYAQKMLGDCYANGHGVDKNEELANYWYGKANGN